MLALLFKHNLITGYWNSCLRFFSVLLVDDESSSHHGEKIKVQKLKKSTDESGRQISTNQGRCFDVWGEDVNFGTSIKAALVCAGLRACCKASVKKPLLWHSLSTWILLFIHSVLHAQILRFPPLLPPLLPNTDIGARPALSATAHMPHTLSLFSTEESVANCVWQLESSQTNQRGEESKGAKTLLKIRFRLQVSFICPLVIPVWIHWNWS